jgi:hypothetical protein
VHSSPADYAAQFDLSRRIWELMDASAAAFQALSPLEEQLNDRKKALPAGPAKELTDSIADAEKQIGALQTGTELAPGFGTLNRDLGRYLVMVQGGDIAPTESARRSFQFSCESFARNATAVNKLASETLPALNKKLAEEKLAPLVYAHSSASNQACTQ